MTSLPTLRRKILRSFSFVVGLYAVLGLLLVMSVQIASNTSPKLLHVNYDSIAAASRMKDAWTDLQFPDFSPKQSEAQSILRFNEALAFEQQNITEPGEGELVTQLTENWKNLQPELGHLSTEKFDRVRLLLEQVVALNERGMFGLAQGNETLSREVLIGTLIYFLVSLILSILFADNLSQRLSRPLKSIVEALHSRPHFDRKLKLPEPTNLELLILTTELKRLWERLGENEKVNVTELLKEKGKLETLLESVEDALLVLHPDGRVSLCNARLASLIGLDRVEVQDQSWSDLGTLNENYLRLRSTLRDGMPEGQQIDLEWNHATFHFSARSRRIEIERRHEQAGILFLLHDITDKKQREKFRSEFIDLLSHELKTPLQSLGTAAELLSAQKSKFDGDVELLVDTISEDVERIRAVAHEFVQVTQSHSKIMKINLEMVAISQVLGEWLKPFHVVAKDRGVRIDFVHEGSDVIWAHVDPIKFPWVVSNILSNAIRFSPSGSVVQVLLTDRRGNVEIRIRDDGPGIPEADRGRIFEPFYQASVSGPSNQRGLFGIGLTIAKEVVEAHDGRIEYAPIAPQGSEFRILLPFPPIQYGKVPEDERGDTKSWAH